MQTATIDREMLSEAAVVRRRASDLRTEAFQLDEVIATTYRRRAAELELEAWVKEIQSGLPYDEITTAA